MQLPALIKPFTVHSAAARNQRACQMGAMEEAILQLMREIPVIITKVWVDSRYNHGVKVKRKSERGFKDNEVVRILYVTLFEVELKYNELM